MKKFIFICLLFVTLHSHADEWESSWIAALEDLHNEDHVSAEQNFNLTIHRLESDNNSHYPSVYADRARLLMTLNRYEEALKDIDQALLSENLNNQERVKAVVTRFKAKKLLGVSEGLNEDIEFLVNNFEIQFENTENYVIIRNIPKDNAVRQSIVHSFLASGLCDKEEDIKQLSSDTCIVNKTYRKTDTAVADISKHVADIRLVEACKRWCDANAVASISWCSNYPELRLINACNSAVYEIQNNCRQCCYNYPQDVCAAPFGDIVAVMQKYLTCPCCGN